MVTITTLLSVVTLITFIITQSFSIISARVFFALASITFTTVINLIILKSIMALIILLGAGGFGGGSIADAEGFCGLQVSSLLFSHILFSPLLSSLVSSCLLLSSCFLLSPLVSS